MDRLADQLVIERIERDARALYETDKTYCYRDMLKTADHAAALLRETGARVTVTPLRADGVTTYLDYIMPQAWDVEDGRLEVVAPSDCACPVLADYPVDRFVIPNRCMATPKGGITAELVPYDERDRKDIRGKWVLIKTPAQNVKAELIAHGAAGIVSYFSESGDTMPDTVFWHNGWSQGTGWYHCKAEPRIVMFSISARRGKMLEDLLAKGRNVVLKGFVKSRTYDGVIKSVSGLIPGKKKQEILILGHMYEPLADDNPAGNAAMIEICRTINQQVKRGIIPQPYYSIRFLLSMERYGMGQFFASPARSRNTLAAISVDSIAMDQSKTDALEFFGGAPMAFPFFGDIVMGDLIAKYNTHPFRRDRGGFGDDTFMSDPMIGVPALWHASYESRYHHNTANTFDVLDWSNALEKTGIIIRYVASLAWMNPASTARLLPRILRGVKEDLNATLDELRQPAQEHDRESLDRNIRFLLDAAQAQMASLARFGAKPAALRKAREQIDRHVKGKAAAIFAGARVTPTPVDAVRSPEERRARNTIPKRLTRGLPFDLARIPFAERKRYHANQERFVAWMDGRRTLWEVIQCFALDLRSPVTAAEIGSLIQYTNDLARYGYLKLVPQTTVGKSEIKLGLHKLGTA